MRVPGLYPSLILVKARDLSQRNTKTEFEIGFSRPTLQLYAPIGAHHTRSCCSPLTFGALPVIEMYIFSANA